MSGIVSYTGNCQAEFILLDSLAKLRYRSYDSAGLAMNDDNKDTVIIKVIGGLQVLAKRRMMEKCYLEHAILVIPTGRHMGRFQR